MKSFKHFDQMNSFMDDKHEIAMPFVRNSSRDSSTFSGSEQEVSSSLHSEEQENEEDRSEVPKKKGKVRKGKSPKKVKGNLKDYKDERWYALFDKQTKVLEVSQKNKENYFKFLSESEARGRELMITAIRELGTVLGGIKNREKVNAGVEISDEED